MTCEEALLAISAALDGELPPAERAKLSEHLVQCESCRALAEDLRVLTDALEDSDREPPSGLAESVRAAVAAEPSARKRRPPYLRGRLGLRTIAAMLALCVGLGGIGLFISGQNGKGADSGAAPALYQAPQASQAAPEAMEKSAAVDCDGLSDEADRAAGYSVTDGADPAEAPMAAKAPMEAANEEGQAPLPMPSSAPSDMVEVRGGGGPSSDGGYDSPAPDKEGENGTQMEKAPSGGDAAAVTAGSPEGAAPSSDGMNGGESLSLTPEEALELVFQYVGGYEEYPEARQRTVSMYGFDAPAYYLQTVETDVISSEYCLDYTGLSDDGESYQFHLFELVTDKTDGTGHTATMNWVEVSLDSGEITTMF